MKAHLKEGISYLTFDLFEEFPNLVHGVFLRHGGSSSGPFDSLNFGLTAGDDPKCVALNRKKALRVLNLSSYSICFQEHKTNVVWADPLVKEKGDILITDQKSLGLMILHADCQAAIFYDPINKAMANVHCGWRGNVQNVYKKAIEAMKQQFGSFPENLLVGISPSLGPSASEFINYKTELPESFYPFQVKPNYFDLWEISKWQLLKEGILPHHIEIASICTYSNPKDFFSYRREKASGRHATIAALI